MRGGVRQHGQRCKAMNIIQKLFGILSRQTQFYGTLRSESAYSLSPVQTRDQHMENVRSNITQALCGLRLVPDESWCRYMPDFDKTIDWNSGDISSVLALLGAEQYFDRVGEHSIEDRNFTPSVKLHGEFLRDSRGIISKQSEFQVARFVLKSWSDTDEGGGFWIHWRELLVARVGNGRFRYRTLEGRRRD